MSYAVRRVAGTGGQSSPPEQPTTALVLSYRCLFTHDLKQKRKRWQDGKLKYHTFNKRIMVFDDRNNFIGDSHWHEDGDLAEDDEVSLDRGGAIVQVADCEGSREQDITEIVDKRAREVAKRRELANQTPRAKHDQRSSHRPLSSIVPSPGHIGRAAIPSRSPFEIRKDGASERPKAPPAKRKRTEESPPSKVSHAASLFGARLNLSASTVPLSTLRMRAIQERSNGHKKPEQDTQDLEMQTPEIEPKQAENTVPLAEAVPQCDVVHVDCISHTAADGAAEIVSRDEKSVSGTGTRDAVKRRTKPAPALTTQPNRSAAQEKTHFDFGLEALDHCSTKVVAKPAEPRRQSPKARAPAAVAPSMTNCSHQPANDQNRNKDDPGKQHGSPNLSRGVASPQRDSPVAPPEHDSSSSSSRPFRARTSSAEPQPRTELRIKSRKRRGLLMMSEQKPTPKPDPKPKRRTPEDLRTLTTPEPQPIILDVGFGKEAAILQDEDGEVIEATPEPKHPPEPALSAESSDDSESSTPPQKRRTVKTTSCASNSEATKRPLRRRRNKDDQSESDDTATGTTKGRMRKRGSPGPSEHEPDSEQAPQGPRITKLARKGIKSREIIGFTPEMLNTAPAPFAMASNMIGTVGRPPTGPIRPEQSVKLNINRSVSKQPLDTQQQRAEPPITDQVKPQEPEDNTPEAVGSSPKGDSPENSEPGSKAGAPAKTGESDSDLAIDPTMGARDGTEVGAQARITNPATRGKKAARKEDAAGLALQHTVPFEAPQGNRTVKPVEPNNCEGSLPGFSKANGGAWSKHAEDLLGMTRPACKS